MANKNDLVVKSNRLVEASYRLTLAEQRIILQAIAEARRTGKGLTAEDFVDIVAADYAVMFDLPLKQAYEQVKEAVLTLFDRYVVMHGICPKTGKPEVIKVRWLSAASYIDGAGTVRLRFAPDMVPFIVQLEARFTRYKLEKVANMSSIYAIRLYELLVQWGSVGKREIELQWLKKALDLETEYPSIKDFKMRVIDVAVAQINEHSDLTASYAQRKTGRTVSHFTFSFAPKEPARPREEPARPREEPAEPPDAQGGVRDSALFLRLRGHNIPAKLAEAWIRHNAPHVQAMADHVEALARAGKVKGATGGYLRRMVDLEAEAGPSAFQAGVKAEAQAARQAQHQAESDAKRERAEKERKSLDDEAKSAEWFKSLPEESQMALERAFLEKANRIDAQQFKKLARSCMGFCLYVKKTWKERRAPDGLRE